MEIYEKDLSDLVIGCAFEVYNTLGCGYLEKVYENALLKELSLKGIRAQSQVPIKVIYKDQIVGDYYSDIIINQRIILELKHASEISPKHIAQLINYLKATGIKVGYVLNFGNERKLQFKRIVF